MNISHCCLLLWCDWTPPPHWSLWLSSNLTAATDVFLKSILVHIYTLSFQEIKSKFLDRTRLNSWIHSPFPCTLACTLSIAPCFDTSFFKSPFTVHSMSYLYWNSPTYLCFVRPRLLQPMPASAWSTFSDSSGLNSRWLFILDITSETLCASINFSPHWFVSLWLYRII